MPGSCVTFDSALIDMLHYGLAVILAFVALKMLLAHWIEVPVTISLAVILITLLIFAIASKMIPEKRQI